MNGISLELHTKHFHHGQLGPVDWAETQWHNACGPSGGYRSEVRQAASPGQLLAGLAFLPDASSCCGPCIYVTTATGKSARLRVVTHGDTSENSIDVSPEASAILDSSESTLDSLAVRQVRGAGRFTTDGQLRLAGSESGRRTADQIRQFRLTSSTAP